MQKLASAEWKERKIRDNCIAEKRSWRPTAIRLWKIAHRRENRLREKITFALALRRSSLVSGILRSVLCCLDEKWKEEDDSGCSWAQSSEKKSDRISLFYDVGNKMLYTQEKLLVREMLSSSREHVDIYNYVRDFWWDPCLPAIWVPYSVSAVDLHNVATVSRATKSFQLIEIHLTDCNVWRAFN